MTNKQKYLTILVLFLILLFLSGFKAFGGRTKAAAPAPVAELKGKNLGGAASRMPDSSSKILFESILGTKLGAYYSYESVDEVLYSLRAGKISAAWFPDITANYLINKETDLRILETPDPVEDRFSFGLALKNDERGNELCESMNEAIAVLKETGRLDSLVESYGPYGTAPSLMHEDEMVVNTQDTYKDKDRLYIGICGCIPPVDMVDRNGEAQGFSVAFCDELAQLLGKRVSFVYQKEETMFSALMAGRIDAVLCYGSGINTVDTGKSYVVTDGYLDMKKYEFVVLGD